MSQKKKQFKKKMLRKENEIINTPKISKKTKKKSKISKDLIDLLNKMNQNIKSYVEN